MVLGGLFVLAGYLKLQDPTFFAFTINGFHMGLDAGLVNILAHVVPWTEVIAGSMLVLGLWARGAALVIVLMLVAFIAGIVSVMVRGLDVHCGCFGKALKLFCGDLPLGWCHLIRNAIMAGAGVLVVMVGPGVAALDNCGQGCGGKRV
jgi:uncharacterized membrane protein YphA (DoxX/SURF4 family)